MILLVYSIVSLFNCMVVLFPALHDIHCTSMAWYSLFVLKVPLNNNKPIQTYWCNIQGFRLWHCWLDVTRVDQLLFFLNYFVKLRSVLIIFGAQIPEWICNKTVTKLCTSPNECHYTTLWNTRSYLYFWFFVWPAYCLEITAVWEWFPEDLALNLWVLMMSDLPVRSPGL